jgi:hypothetical protein
MHKCLYVGQIAEYGIGNASEDKLALKPLLFWAEPTVVRLGLKPHVPTIRTNQQQIENTGRTPKAFMSRAVSLDRFPPFAMWRVMQSGQTVRRYLTAAAWSLISGLAIIPLHPQEPSQE